MNMDTSTLEEMMAAVEEREYNAADFVDVVSPSDILVARYQCAEALLGAINNGAITDAQAMSIYAEGIRREIENAMLKPTAAGALVRARLKETLPPQQTGPWSAADVVKRSSFPRNTPGVALDTLMECVLQVGDQGFEYDEGADAFRILGADGKVRTFPYEKLKTFRPSAFSGEKGIRRWEEGFRRRRSVDTEA
jgi:hypothetical protein